MSNDIPNKDTIYIQKRINRMRAAGATYEEAMHRLAVSAAAYNKSMAEIKVAEKRTHPATGPVSFGSYRRRK